MAQLRIRSNGSGDSFLYVQNDDGSSVAIGGDNGTFTFNVNTSASPNVVPDESTSNIAIDPSANGDIVFSPNGSGLSDFINGNLRIGAANSVGNLLLTETNSSLTKGVIEINSERFLHRGGNQDNVFLGRNAGNGVANTSANIAIGTDALKNVVVVGATGNTVIGHEAGAAITISPNNVLIGYQSGKVLGAVIDQEDNTAVGYQTLLTCEGQRNTAVGSQALYRTTDASDNNIAIGYRAGSNYTSGESNNILIGNEGLAAENNTMRLGSSGNTSRTYIAGGYGVSPTGSPQLMLMASNGQIGTTSGGSYTTNSYTTDSGSAAPSGGSLTISGGLNTATSGSGSTVTVGMDNVYNVTPSGGNDGMVIIDSNGELGSQDLLLMPNNSAFFAYVGTSVNNVSGNGAFYTLGTSAMTEVFDQNGDFNTNGTFTAPVTGRYMLSAAVLITGCTIATTLNVRFITSNRTYLIQYQRPAGSSNLYQSGSHLADMDASDTCTVQIEVSGEAGNTADLFGSGSPNLASYFSGYLAS